MEKWQVILLLLFGFGLFGLSVFLRSHYSDKYDPRIIDLILIILPLLFVLLVTGKLQVFDAFGIKADLSELFADAAGTTIEQQVAAKSSPGVDEVVHMLEMATKGGVRKIPELIENKTEALIFQLGHGGYYGPAIQQYFDALYASSYLQYLIIKDKEGKLFALYNVLDLNVYFRINKPNAYEDFAHWLNKADNASKESLSKLPGFVGAEQALAREMSKRDVLKRMDNLRLDSLPVIDKSGVFVGTVERSQLTASLILEVVSRLDGNADSSGLP